MYEYNRVVKEQYNAMMRHLGQAVDDPSELTLEEPIELMEGVLESGDGQFQVKKVIWVSRVPMTKAQHDDLTAELMKTGWIGRIGVVHENRQFLRRGQEGLEALVHMVEHYGATILAGMFPPHIVARYCRARSLGFAMALPITVVAPPTEAGVSGEASHSHFEWA